MFTLFNANQVVSQLSETTKKDPNSLGMLGIGLIATGVVGLGVCVFWLYKRFSNNNAQLRHQVTRTQQEIKTTQAAVDELREDTTIVRHSIVHLNQEVQVAQRELEQLQQQASETQRLLDGHERSSYTGR